MTVPGQWYPDSSTAAGDSRYACVLDEQPGWAAPPRPTPVRPGAALEPADGLATRDTADLGLGEQFRPGPVAVTANPSALPFWLGAEGQAAIQALLAGGPALTRLSERWRTLLVAAGLAVEPGKAPPAPIMRPMAAAPGCVLTRDLVHPFHLAALRLHTRRLVRTSATQNGDGQTPLRWVRHNEPIAAWVHQHLTAPVSAALATPVKPSYVYSATYHDGADLQMHTDRAQCRYTLSLSVDCLPDPSGPIPWPLILEPPQARLRVQLGLGEGLLYGGTEIPHGRPRMPPGLVVTAFFFHFVDAGFSGSLN